MPSGIAHVPQYQSPPLDPVLQCDAEGVLQHYLQPMRWLRRIRSGTSSPRADGTCEGVHRYDPPFLGAERAKKERVQAVAYTLALRPAASFVLEPQLRRSHYQSVECGSDVDTAN
jgi:hypothetical protein